MIFIIILGILFVYALYEYRNIQTKHLNAKDFNQSHSRNIRIVYLSDIQYDLKGMFFQNTLMKQIVSLINKENPDIVVFGGDYIHHKSTKVFEYLKMIEAPKIGIVGNHDYKDLEGVIKGCQNSQIKLLINQTYAFNNITFIGLDDLREGHPHLPNLNPNDYHVLLIHDPDQFETLTNTHQFNVTLAGHLHGGQVTLFGKYAPILPSKYGQKYRYGFIKRNNSTLYVSSGLGGWVFGLPLRFFAKPEIVIIDL